MQSVSEVDILAIGVHPDDIELACSGSLLHHIDLGHRIGLLDLTRGELGTRGNAELRTKEAMTAAQQMAAIFRYQLELKDGFFNNEESSLLEIIKIIRAAKPKIVFANAIKDRHPDHGRAAQLIHNACFYSGLIKIETYWNDKLQAAWRPNACYHYIQDYQLKPDLVIDISKQIEKKMQLIQCFASQFYNPNSNEPESPISNKQFLDVVKANAQVMGRLIQVEYGEGFTVDRPIGINDILTLK